MCYSTQFLDENIIFINEQTQLILQSLHFALDISLLVSQIICFSNNKKITVKYFKPVLSNMIKEHSS